MQNTQPIAVTGNPSHNYSLFVQRLSDEEKRFIKIHSHVRFNCTIFTLETPTKFYVQKCDRCLAEETENARKSRTTKS